MCDTLEPDGMRGYNREMIAEAGDPSDIFDTLACKADLKWNVHSVIWDAW